MDENYLSPRFTIFQERKLVHMKRIALTLTFILALLVSTMILFGTVNFGKAQSGTNVTGVIGSDTTWTLANSPYNLTGNVLVNNGVTLYIQAGTTVNLGSYYIEVNGTLQAIGYGANSITFNGGQITFTQYSTNWNESSSTGCIIQNANLTSDLTFSNSAKISSNSIYGAVSTNDYANEYAESIISNNIIEGGVVLEGQDLVLNNTILNQGITIWCTNATVSGNII
jgi:hypothetical protein